jgi:hypothetical protein
MKQFLYPTKFIKWVLPCLEALFEISESHNRILKGIIYLKTVKHLLNLSFISIKNRDSYL